MKGAAKAKQGRAKMLMKVGLVLLLIIGAFLFLKHRKETFIRECTRHLEASLSHGTDYKVRIGRVSGHLAGFVSFRDVKVEEPWLPEGEETVFQAEEIRFNYNWLDFFSKNFISKMEMTVTKPVVFWHPRVGLKKPDFPFLTWIRDWAISQKNRLVIRIQSMTLIMGDQKKAIRNIDISFEDNVFHAEIPLSHIRLGASDLSSVIKFEGRFESGITMEQDALRGQITTEGTVINWKPLPYEAQFDFDFSREGFHMSSSSFLGGAEVSGRIDFLEDYNIDWNFKAQNYPLSNLDPFFGFGKDMGPQGRMDVTARFRGSPWAPAVEGRCRITDGWVSKKAFKAMDVSVQGVYPTVRLSDSHILLQDGSSMRIADKTLEIVELFKGKTYESLVNEAQQDTVVWGDWELSRQKDDQDRPEFMMQRNFGDKANVHFTKFTSNDKPIESRQSSELEVGFEYRLRAKDSLKFEFRDDEEFVGVERKMKF